MPNHFVYCITNLVDGKKYVGRTRNSQSRWKTHCAYARSDRGFRIHAAMRQTGIDAFKFEVVRVCNDLTSALEVEASLIKEWATNDPRKGYNITQGGDEMAQVARLAADALRVRTDADPEAERERNSRRGRKAATTLGPDAVRKKMEKARAALSSTKLTQMGHDLVAALDSDQRKAKAKKANETLGREGRSARARKAVNSLGPDGLSARAKKAVAAQSPEQRSEARRKAWATRRERLGKASA